MWTPFLRGTLPSPSFFQNRSSVHSHRAFVEAEIQACLSTGAVKELVGEFEPVVVKCFEGGGQGWWTQIEIGS
jgi:hypothetical protein